MSPIRKILVPTDFSPHAQEAFRVAHDLAKATRAGVVVFHVSRPPAVVSDGDRLLSAPAQTEAKDDVWEELRKLQANDPAVRVEHEVIKADPVFREDQPRPIQRVPDGARRGQRRRPRRGPCLPRTVLQRGLTAPRAPGRG